MNKIIKYFIFLLVALLLVGALASFMAPRTPETISATSSQSKGIAAPPPPIDTVEPDKGLKLPIVTTKPPATASTKVATNSVKLELSDVQKELIAHQEVLSENKAKLYSEVMEVQKLSKLGVAALAEVAPIKNHLSNLRRALLEVESQLEDASEKSIGSLHEQLDMIKEKMTEAKDLLKEKEDNVAEYKKAYDKANTAKFATQREHLEHMAWQNQLIKRINELTPELSETE